MSIFPSCISFLFGHGFRAPVYLQLCSASSALSFTQRERFSHARENDTLETGNGVHTHKGPGRIRQKYCSNLLQEAIKNTMNISS